MSKTSRSPVPATRDTFVHYLFGTPGNELILLSFINAVLRSALRPLVKSVEMLNPFNPATFVTDKYTALDVKATDTSGKIFAIEFQSWEHASFIERILFNWAKTYSRQLKEGEPYRVLPEVICLVITSFCLFRELRPLLNSFYLTSYDNPEYILTDALQIYTVEATKDKIGQINDYKKPLQRWLIFFYYSDKKSEEEMKILLKGDTAVERAYTEYQKFCEDEELRRLDDARQRFMHDYVSDVDAAYTKGMTDGEAKGKLEGKLEGQMDAILTVLKANLKRRVPQRIVNVLQTQTDATVLESLLVKAASCRSLEEFESELL